MSRSSTARFPEVSDTLIVNEIYLSIQGESTFAGLPCIFVRLTACNLRCSYCDTAYAFSEGRKLPLAGIRSRIAELARLFPVDSAAASERTHQRPGAGTTALHTGRLPLVELTGGEPLLQPDSVPLMTSLCDDGFTVLLETSGALDIAPVDPRVHRIMDLKCPGSGEVSRNRWENLKHLKGTDEIKFVIGSREDYDWATRQMTEHGLASLCPILFSWVSPLEPHQKESSLKAIPPGQTPISRQALVEQIIADALPVRFQLQMHKFIWRPDQRSV